MQKLDEGEKVVMRWLIDHSFCNRVSVHTKDVERTVIPTGQYCLSVSKYLRNLRSYGYIKYPDPRLKINAHNYIITILSDIEGHPIQPAKEAGYIEQGRLFL